MRRTQVGMRATVAQALRLRQNFFCIVIEIGHSCLFFIFTAFQMQNPCQGPRSAKNAPNTVKTAISALNSKKMSHFSAAFFQNKTQGCLILHRSFL
jgi:hypothetical protein